jgi:hypothetical protein
MVSMSCETVSQMKGDSYGKAKMTTAEAPLPPKNAEIAPEVAAT